MSHQSLKKLLSPASRVAIYVRVSTQEQAEHGYSLGTQLDACRQKAQELGALTIREFVDDGQSGEFLDRPALTELRRSLKQQDLDAVIVYDPDRLARNLAHQLMVAEEIEKSGAELVFVSVTFEQSPEGRLFFSIRGAISSFEKEKIKERTMRGKRGKAAQGKVVTNANPLGYDYDAAASMYVINDEEAKLVRKIFDHIVTDKIGTARICKELNALGIPSPRGKAWIVSSIHRILTNTIYKGIIYSMKYQYQKIGLKKKKRTLRPDTEWIPVRVPAIVDEEVWEAAQRQLKANKDESKRNLKYDHLLNGLVVCSHCGRKMVITHSAIPDLAYYACLSQRSTSYFYSDGEKCPARRIPTTVLDDYVFGYLQEIHDNPILIAAHLQAAPEKKDTRELREKLAHLTSVENNVLKQRETVMRWFRQQKISEQDADQQLEDIRLQVLDIQDAKRRYQAELTAVSPSLSVAEVAANLAVYFNKEDFSEDEKKIAVKALLEKVVAARTDHTAGRGSKPELSVRIAFAKSPEPL